MPQLVLHDPRQGRCHHRMLGSTMFTLQGTRVADERIVAAS
jgi:hypothetical protein